MTAIDRKLDSVTVSMNYVELNNLVIAMKNPIKRARSFIITKLTIKVESMKKKIENRTDDKKIHADRLQSRLTDEINELKNIKIDQYIDIAKQALYCDTPFDKIASKEDAKRRCYARIGYHKEVLKHVQKFRAGHRDWKSLAAYLLSKNTGRRYKSKQINLAAEQESIKNMANILNSSKANIREFLTKDKKVEKDKDSGNDEEDNEDSSSSAEGEQASASSTSDADEDDKQEDNESDKQEDGDSSGDEESDDSAASNEPTDEDESDSSVEDEHTEMVIQKFDIAKLQTADISYIGKPSTKTAAHLAPPISAKLRHKVQENDFFMAGSSDEGEDDETSPAHNDVEAPTSTVTKKVNKVSCKEVRKNRFASTFIENLSNKTMRFPASLQSKIKDVNKKDTLKRKVEVDNDTDNHNDNKKSKYKKEVKYEKAVKSKSKAAVPEEILHPSWEASRKRKLLNKDTTFSGTKITFDD